MKIMFIVKTTITVFLNITRHAKVLILDNYSFIEIKPPINKDILKNNSVRKHAINFMN